MAKVYFDRRTTLCTEIAFMKHILETSLSCDLDVQINIYGVPGLGQSHLTHDLRQRLALHSIRLLAPYAHQLRFLWLDIPRSASSFSILSAFPLMPRLVGASIATGAHTPYHLSTPLIDIPDEILGSFLPWSIRFVEIL
jgi:hypothetical protein